MTLPLSHCASGSGGIDPYFKLKVGGVPEEQGGPAVRTAVAHGTRSPDYDSIDGFRRTFALPVADPITQVFGFGVLLFFSVFASSTLCSSVVCGPF